MMVSLFYAAFWAIMRGANFARPSALHRSYVQIWLFIVGWAMLVVVTVTEDRLRIGAGYMFVFLQSALFLSLFIALCELFALPKKSAWAQKVRDEQEERDFHRGRSHGDLSPTQLPPPVPNHESTPPGTRHSNHSTSAPANLAEQPDGDDADAEAPNERTPLVGGTAPGDERPRTTFATTYRRSISALVNGARRYSDSGLACEPFEHEQPWSGRLPSWTWLLQFLILGPFIVILVGQTLLMLLDAVHQTGADGSSLLLPYLIVALCTLLLFLPLAPFIHRVTHHIPVFLLVVFTATLVYNLAAFPFSAASRYKVYFVQTLDLDRAVSGDSYNKVCYHGIEEYVRPVIAALPSAAGKEVVCGESKRKGLVACCFDGAATPPRLVAAATTTTATTTTATTTDLLDVVGEDHDYGSLVTVNATRTSPADDGAAAAAARIEIAANNTKACFLEFETPVSGLRVRGSSGWDERFGQFPDAGVKSLRLWHRRWDEEWVVEVEWSADDAADDGAAADTSARPVAELDGDNVVSGEGGEGGLVDDDGELRKRGQGLKGAVVCMWSDANVPGTIPALDEALKFVPAWAAVTKLSEGLVEGRKRFEV